MADCRITGDNRSFPFDDMNYIDEIAIAIYKKLGYVEPPGPLSRLYAVLALVKGMETTSTDVHSAWIAWVLELGPDHPWCKPFSELPKDIQEYYDKYRDAIREVVQEMIDREIEQYREGSIKYLER